jgi:hypothetical protein
MIYRLHLEISISLGEARPHFPTTPNTPGAGRHSRRASPFFEIPVDE